MTTIRMPIGRRSSASVRSRGGDGFLGGHLNFSAAGAGSTAGAGAAGGGGVGVAAGGVGVAVPGVAAPGATTPGTGAAGCAAAGRLPNQMAAPTTSSSTRTIATVRTGIALWVDIRLSRNLAVTAGFAQVRGP